MCHLQFCLDIWNFLKTDYVLKKVIMSVDPTIQNLWSSLLGNALWSDSIYQFFFILYAFLYFRIVGYITYTKHNYIYRCIVKVLQITSKTNDFAWTIQQSLGCIRNGQKRANQVFLVQYQWCIRHMLIETLTYR